MAEQERTSPIQDTPSTEKREKVEVDNDLRTILRGLRAALTVAKRLLDADPQEINSELVRRGIEGPDLVKEAQELTTIIGKITAKLQAVATMPVQEASATPRKNNENKLPTKGWEDECALAELILTNNNLTHSKIWRMNVLRLLLRLGAADGRVVAGQTFDDECKQALGLKVLGHTRKAGAFNSLQHMAERQPAILTLAKNTNKHIQTIEVSPEAVGGLKPGERIEEGIRKADTLERLLLVLVMNISGTNLAQRIIIFRKFLSMQTYDVKLSGTEKPGARAHMEALKNALPEGWVLETGGNYKAAAELHTILEKFSPKKSQLS